VKTLPHEPQSALIARAARVAKLFMPADKALRFDASMIRCRCRFWMEMWQVRGCLASRSGRRRCGPPTRPPIFLRPAPFLKPPLAI
jgi:hypothetical protein